MPTTRVHLLDETAMLLAVHGDPEARIENGAIVISDWCSPDGIKLIRLHHTRHARQLAYQLCELADELERRGG